MNTHETILGEYDPSVADVVITKSTPDLQDGASTIFGKRYGGDTFFFSGTELQALLNGATFAIDVASEYVIYLKLEPNP